MIFGLTLQKRSHNGFWLIWYHETMYNQNLKGAKLAPLGVEIDDLCGTWYIFFQQNLNN